MHRLLSSIILCCIFSVAHADTHAPFCFWYWMYGAVSEQGIKADLQAMKDAGLGGCYLMPIRGAEQAPATLPPLGTTPAQQLTPQFWTMVDCALSEASRLGLEMGIHICDGFALAGGPWISPAESMQKVVWTDTIVGGGHHRFTMRRPESTEGYYEDIGLYAVPVEATALTVMPTAVSHSPTMTQNAKGVWCADEPAYLQYDLGRKTLVRSVEIEPSGTNIQCQRLLVKASDDGIVFSTVKQLVPPRQGWQNTGFNTTFSIPATEARYFRFEWTPEGSEPGAEDLDAAKWKAVLRLRNISLHPYAVIDNYEGKAGYAWRIAPDASDKELTFADYYRPTDLIYARVSGQDLVDIELPESPEGAWRLLRMGHTSTGHTNATAGGGRGLECDKFSRRAVEKQVGGWFGQFMQRPGHSAIKYMHVDSWECGSQNWGSGFAQEFQRRRGYDLLPLLPIYAGVPMKGGDQLLRDIRRTINELVNDVFFTTVAQKARQYGVQLSSESVAPTMVSDGMEHYRLVDLPMGEFWLNSPTHDKMNDMLDAISGAHVYGKQIVMAEGFTEVRGVWDETPASIKPLLDRNFALGMNRLFFHVFTHNPYTDKKPGMTLDGIGLFFQRDQTWFSESRAMVDYITRCQRLLQQGSPVVDIAVFAGEEMPCRALTPDRVVPLLPGLFGADRVAAERQRLANVGQPMEESPVGVRHSAGIIDPKDWVNAMHGYHYDTVNRDALLNATFNYRVLVVPGSLRLSPEVRSRLSELADRGVLILRTPYEASYFGGLPPDAVLPDGIGFCHRATSTEDIYFLCNQRDETVSFSPQFRSRRATTSVYDPVNDKTYAYDGTIQLAAGASCFVIFADGGSPTLTNRQSAGNGQPVRTLRTEVSAWDVTFRENGVSLKRQQLFDWSSHSDSRVRFFSGHARYKATLTVKEKLDAGSRLWLSMPRVSDIAHVWINGKDCGIAWTAPYRVEATRALKKGKNVIEIEVVNTWHNALRGYDQGTPPYEGIWTNARYRTSGTSLLPAGLLAQPEVLCEQ